MKIFIGILMALMTLAAITPIHAQNTTVNYTYDQCGNRIQRTLGFKKVEDKSPVKDAPNDMPDDESWLSEANDSFADANLSLFPNPTTDRFTLSLSGLEAMGAHVQLCTMEGVVIEKRDITNQCEEFDLGGKAAGIYLLHLQAGNEAQTWKIIKKN